MSSQSSKTAQSLPQPIKSQPIEPPNPASCLDNSLDSPLPLTTSTHDPYLDLPVIGIGMTGIVHEIGEDRVVKKAKKSQLRDAGDAEYMNKMNQEILENEIQVFKRLDNGEGIIPCFRLSQYGIELVRASEDLESYLENHPERENTLKVFVDDIAPRNILILDDQPKVADFGQSVLLPLDADIASANTNDLNVRIEILHLGWILYSIASWHVNKYYFFDENPDLCWPVSFPNVDGVVCGEIIKKCWHGEYVSMDNVKLEALQLLCPQRTRA